jgi:multidrug efflux system membrane fusion protein
VEGELTQVAFVEGQMVQEGDLLAEIDPRPYQVQRDQAEAQLRRDEVTLRAAQQTLERYMQLRQELVATAQQVDDQKALVDQMEAALRADQALIANADLQLAYCRIVAPISGRIGLRMVDKGNIVRPGDPNGLAVITQLQPIALVFNVPQDEISRVLKAQGSGADLQVDAFDRDFRNHLATGKLLAIDNQVDPTNGTVRLKAEFPNDDGLLFPNQFVNARLLVETRRNVTVAPSAAVQRGPNGTFVYVVQPDETVDVRLVSVGQTEGSDTAVESGLEPGELVVTDGLDKLAPGAKVALRDAKTNGAVAGSEAAGPAADKPPAQGRKTGSEVGSEQPATSHRG